MLFFLNNLVGKVVFPEFYTEDKLKKKRKRHKSINLQEWEK